MTDISFYDQSRMGYTGDIGLPRDGAEAEWMVGDYGDEPGSGCGTGGEFSVQLVRFRSGAGVRVAAFTDALGSLHALLDSGALELLEQSGPELTPTRVTEILASCGLRDDSRLPLGGEAPVGRARRPVTS